MKIFRDSFEAVILSCFFTISFSSLLNQICCPALHVAFNSKSLAAISMLHCLFQVVHLYVFWKLSSSSSSFLFIYFFKSRYDKYICFQMMSKTNKSHCRSFITFFGCSFRQRYSFGQSSILKMPFPTFARNFKFYFSSKG